MENITVELNPRIEDSVRDFKIYDTKTNKVTELIKEKVWWARQANAIFESIESSLRCREVVFTTLLPDGFVELNDPIF
jgi:hypothetical protein